MLWKLVENVKYEDIYEVTFPAVRDAGKQKGLAGFMESAWKENVRCFFFKEASMRLIFILLF